MAPCLPTTGCWLMHGLPYIFLRYVPSFFFFLLSAGLFACLEVHPSVPHSFAPVLITFSTWFAFDLAAYQCRLLLTALSAVGSIGIPSEPHTAVHHNDCYRYCYYYYCL